MTNLDQALEVRLDEAVLDRLDRERQLVRDILEPFYALEDLLGKEARMVSAPHIASLLDLALGRAEHLARGD